MQKGSFEAEKKSVIKLFTKPKFTIDQVAEYLEFDKQFVIKTLEEKGFI